MKGFEAVVTAFGGFEKAIGTAIPSLPALLQIETDLCFAVLTDLINGLIARRRIDDLAKLEELSRALERLLKDAQDGLLFSYAWNTGIARKLPLV